MTRRALRPVQGSASERWRPTTTGVEQGARGPRLAANEASLEEVRDRVTDCGALTSAQVVGLLAEAPGGDPGDGVEGVEGVEGADRPATALARPSRPSQQHRARAWSSTGHWRGRGPAPSGAARSARSTTGRRCRGRCRRRGRRWDGGARRAPTPAVRRQWQSEGAVVLRRAALRRSGSWLAPGGGAEVVDGHQIEASGSAGAVRTGRAGSGISWAVGHYGAQHVASVPSVPARCTSMSTSSGASSSSASRDCSPNLASPTTTKA